MIEITVDASKVFGMFERLQSAAPAALALGTNRTVEEALVEAGRLISGKMTIREKRMLPPILLPRAWRATPQNPGALMALGDNEGLGLRRKQVLSKFEDGGHQVAKDLARYPFMAPTSALRSSPGTVIPRSLYPRNMVGLFNSKGEFQGLSRTANTKTRFKKLKNGDISVYKKQVGRFFVMGSSSERGRWGVWERTGPGKHDIRQLWHFFQQKNVPKLLQWGETAQRIADTRFIPNLLGAMDVAIEAAAK